MEGIEITNGMIDSVKDYAILTMDGDRHILSWNTGAHEMFGYTREEITGRPIDVLFTDDDVKNGQPEKEVEASLNERRGPNDIWLKRKDGSTFYANGLLSKLEEQAAPARFIKIVRDWTEQKKMEDALKDANRHKNEFLATLAHELRNPLASINSGLEVLNDAPDDESRTASQAAIYRQVQQMIHLVNDLLDISRISLGKIKFKSEPVNLVEAIKLGLETSRHIIDGHNHDLK
ncbi:MAG TPA: histidine kinase dimerization/phospho-acceptor domain-containing protein, partial [Chitinophagaceae bacterium]|nr:histidine kinase dimerization/phospho-acceptor domain-containing protein [Chitinophagaceae bacterium]